MKKTFSILGDSYSTFLGWIPEEYFVYYPRVAMVPDVLQVEDTWWHQLMKKYDLQLLQNNSYSGSTVCTQVREGQPDSSAFVVRAKQYFSAVTNAEPQPDYLFLFGMTNDNWLGREAGEVQFENWQKADLDKALPAYCFVLDHLTKENPDSCVVCVINTNLRPEIAEGLAQAATHYGATAVCLQDIEKKHGHPTKKGMRQIFEQVEKVLFHN